MKYLVELQKHAHPVSANAGEDDGNQVFANGTALYSPLTWGTAVLNDSTYTDFHEVWNMDLSPKGTTPGSDHRALAGGFGQFMPTWGSNRDTAFAWIKFLNSGDREDLGGSASSAPSASWRTPVTTPDVSSVRTSALGSLGMKSASTRRGCPW